MKKASLLLLAVLTLALAGCAPLEPSSSSSLPRFHEGTAANAVVMYYGEQSVYLTRPSTRSGGFLPLMTHATVLEQLSRSEIGRDLAVVVIGPMSSTEEAATLDIWQGDLILRGYHRVVCLRSINADQSGDHIDGLPILRDSAIGLRANANSPISQVAAVPSAP